MGWLVYKNGFIDTEIKITPHDDGTADIDFPKNTGGTPITYVVEYKVGTSCGRMQISQPAGCGTGETCTLGVYPPEGFPNPFPREGSTDTYNFTHEEIPIDCTITVNSLEAEAATNVTLAELPLEGGDWNIEQDSSSTGWLTGVNIDRTNDTITGNVASNSSEGSIRRTASFTATCTSEETCKSCYNKPITFNVSQAGTGGGGPTLRFKLNYDSSYMEDYVFTSNDLNINDNKDGYLVHTSSDGHIEITPTNVSIIAQKKFGVTGVTKECSDLQLDCGYYTYNTKWPFSTDNDKMAAFKRAWEATAINTNWRAADNTTCNNLDYRNNKVTIILDNNTDYYVPYDGHFKIVLNGTDVTMYYRNCSDVDTTTYKSAHYHYGRTADEGQCSNFIIPPHSEITLECTSEVSLEGIRTSQITRANWFMCNLSNKIDTSPGSTHTNYADFFLHRGGFGYPFTNLTVTVE